MSKLDAQSIWIRALNGESADSDVPALLAKVERLTTELARVTAERDEARRDLEAARHFVIGNARVALRQDRRWSISGAFRPSLANAEICDTRDEALARARELSGKNGGE